MKKRALRFGKVLIKAAFLSAFVLVGIIYTVKVYGQTFNVVASPTKAEEVAYEESVVVDFSQKILPTWRDMKIAVYPEKEVTYSWSLDNRQLRITPVDFWEPGQYYLVTIADAKSTMLLSVNAKISFQTKSLPSISALYPLEGEVDVDVSEADPLFVAFDESVADFNLKLVLDPASNLDYRLDEEKKRVRLVPKVPLLEGQKYAVEVFIKYKKETADKYRKIGGTFFETKQAALAPELWDKEPASRLSQAKRFTKPLIGEGKYVDVNLKEQLLVMFENGEALEAFQISSGKPGMETPNGAFEIHNKAPRVWSKKYGLFMPYWMALVGSGEFGFHELPEWPGGYKEGANHLGRPVSHGCIRLGVGSAKILYDWAEIGTRVEIHY